MNQELINKFLSNSATSSSVDILNYLIALSLSIIFSYILKYVYVNYWRTIADKESISANFVLLTLIVTIIITIVKSSLALSLGLVGALSIVRFRAAIKEPEELIYLFLLIAIGLGCGAGQFIIVFIGTLIVLILIYAHSKIKIKENFKSLDKINLSVLYNFKTKPELKYPGPPGTIGYMYYM